jgi:catechol 2,3-dioxygenase-like lactoylglutathione lyase family enzyme
MAIHDLNHFNIMAAQPLLDELRDFYRDVLGLEDGFRPDLGVPGYWLYADGHPVVHLIDWMRDDEPGSATSPHLDHIAFTCSDLEGMEKRLREQGAAYDRREIAQARIVQLFVKDPGGLGIELNFHVDQPSA